MPCVKKIPWCIFYSDKYGNEGVQVVEAVFSENVGSTICDGPAKIVRSNNRVLLDMEFQADVSEGGNRAEYIWQRQVCLGRHWQL
jgi:hypothetical protein